MLGWASVLADNMDTLVAVGLQLVERQPRFDRMGPAYRVNDDGRTVRALGTVAGCAAMCCAQPPMRVGNGGKFYCEFRSKSGDDIFSEATYVGIANANLDVSCDATQSVGFWGVSRYAGTVLHNGQRNSFPGGRRFLASTHHSRTHARFCLPGGPPRVLAALTLQLLAPTAGGLSNP